MCTAHKSAVHIFAPFTWQQVYIVQAYDIDHSMSLMQHNTRSRAYQSMQQLRGSKLLPASDVPSGSLHISLCAMHTNGFPGAAQECLSKLAMLLKSITPGECRTPCLHSFPAISISGLLTQLPSTLRSELNQRARHYVASNPIMNDLLRIDIWIESQFQAYRYVASNIIMQ